MDFEAVMERIQAITGCRTQVDLAKRLDIRQSSISDAKRRGSVPDSWLVKLFRCYGANPAWILGEAGHPFLVEDLTRDAPAGRVNAIPVSPGPEPDPEPTPRELLEGLREQMGNAFDVVIVPVGTTFTLQAKAKSGVYTMDDLEFVNGPVNELPCRPAA